MTTTIALFNNKGGVGKTTLARGYLEWLAETQGLPHKVVWLSFVDIRSAEYVFNRLVEALFGTDAMALPDAQKWPALLQTMRGNAVLIVWDNFESAGGTADAGLDGTMPGADRQQLKQFLEQLRGGRGQVLITSRGHEDWLGTTACYRIPLGGLQGEERQALAEAILADQGQRLDPRDRAVADLIDSLEGHPLMMRAILPRLGTHNAASLKQAIEHYVPQADSTDPVERKLYATLRFVEDGAAASTQALALPDRLARGSRGRGLLGRHGQGGTAALHAAGGAAGVAAPGGGRSRSRHR
ncbi:MAG: hypothetical protein ACRDQ2_09495 [Gaiellales bacterium]